MEEKKPAPRKRVVKKPAPKQLVWQYSPEAGAVIRVEAVK